MSRLSQEDLKENPAKRTLQWSSQEEKFKYYNKDTKENVFVDLPISFVVLEKDYVSFSGFSDERQNGFWSNEVKNPTDKVIVRCKNEIVSTFLKQEWNQKDKTKTSFKDLPELKGCNYTQVLYVAMKLEDDTTPQIYRLLLSKSSFSGGVTIDKKTGKEHSGQEKDGWIRFLNSCVGGRNAVYQNVFSVVDSKVKKNGAVSYTIPVFSAEPLESGSEYDAMAKEVEEWFKYYNAKPKEETPVLEEATTEYNEDLPDFDGKSEDAPF